MKSKVSVAVGLFVLLFFSPSFARAQQQADLSLRRALYLTKKADKIDLKNDKYVAAGATIVLKKSEANFCNYLGCNFNVGLIAFRDPAQGELNAYVEMKKPDGGVAGNSIYFADKVNTTQMVVALTLTPGSKTQVTCLIDPENKTPESNEKNNSFVVWVTVEP
jgi:hypothetical protein